MARRDAMLIARLLFFNYLLLAEGENLATVRSVRTNGDLRPHSSGLPTGHRTSGNRSVLPDLSVVAIVSFLHFAQRCSSMASSRVLGEI
jgi:hypothetical protein